MRVLVATNMYPQRDRPWFGSFVRDEVEDLQRLGIDVEVLTIDGRRSRLNYLRSAFVLRALVRRDSFDLVHAHYGLTGAVALTQRRLPVVTTFHGSDFIGVPPWHAKVSWVVARTCTPIFVSPEGPRRLGVHDAFVIPAGVDCNLFKPICRQTARRQLGWKPDVRCVLFLGSRKNALKRVDLFDEAVSIVRHDVPDLQAVALENLERAEVALVMNAVDVAVMTSDAEGSPVSVRESLATMTPVVSVDVGDVASVLAGLPGCSVPERDPRRLADGIIAALGARRDQALRERVFASCRPRAAERVADVYATVVGGAS